MRRLRAVAAFATLLLSGGLPAGAGAVTGTLALSGVERAASEPTGLGVDLALDGVVTTSPVLQSARITLPSGLTWTPGAGVGSSREQCDPALFAVASASASRCQAAAQVGTVSAEIPGEPAPWTGTIALGPPLGPGALPSLMVEASESGSGAPVAPRIKLIGGITAGGDGRLELSFDQIPAPAFARLQLTLDGGPSALLTTPASCGALAATATLVDATTGARFDAAAPVTIDAACGAPASVGSAQVVPHTSASGARAPVVIAATQHRGAGQLQQVRASLPGGLLGDLTVASDCSTFPSCPASSHVGWLRLTAGTGSAPLQITGALHLTDRPGGAVAGLAALLHVRSGAADLGLVVASGHVVLRPTDAGLDLVLSLPGAALGVPLALQAAELRFDRDGFVLHPSRCGALGWSAAAVTTTGTAVTAGASTYVGCESRPFAPTLAAALTGETAPRGHPTVQIGLTAREQDAHLGAAVVRLPPNLAADLGNVDHPCPLERFNAVDCSADTRVGTAVARVAVTGEPVPGDVFLVRLPGQVLPGLGMSFTGRFAQRVIATVVFGSDNRLTVTYPGIPDLPLRRLDMTITGGATGPLRIVAGTCKKGMVWDASFVAHGGQRSSHTIPAPCPLANAARARVTLSTRKGMRVRVLDLGGRRLHSAKVTLPPRYSFVKSRADNKRFRSLRLGVGTGRIRVLPRSVQVFPRTRSATRLDLSLKQGTVRGPRIVGKRKPKSLLVQVRLAFTDGTVQRQRIRVQPR